MMGSLNCCCRMSCTALGLITGLIAGVVTLVLNITGTVTVLPLFAWIGFGIAVGFLVVTLLVAAFTNECGKIRECICKALSSVFFGAIGTIITALVLLSVDFGGISIIGAIVYGVFAFFFIFLFIAVTCLTKCYASCEE